MTQPLFAKDPLPPARSKVFLCGMRTLLEDPAPAAHVTCNDYGHSYVTKSTEDVCPVCGCTAYTVVSRDP